MKYLLKITYCGTAYSGFQVQPNANTVQAELMRAAEKIFTVPCLITGCSRTDSGVHALEYLATLETTAGGARIPAEKLPKALAHALPSDISVMEASVAADDFSVRRAVKGKEYMYLLWTKDHMDPFLCERAWHYSRPLDVEKMNLAAKHIVGTHDFASFMASGSDIVDTVRTVSRCEVVKSEDGCVRIYVAADGFLYNMVRIIVGTLIYVSEGKISPDAVKGIIEAKDRTLAGKTAPADGLYLEKVFI
ncbi:MAG: tRNA pseudouridine(38-40) synthase TruA [Ruminococcaceae bacterium]|nr:tRNA pseudouridine(38-40) synthase TruA [Oscillospiraceae bacterium]